MQALHRALQRLALYERARLIPTLLRSSATHATLGEAEIDEPADDNRPTTPWIRTGRCWSLLPCPSLLRCLT